MNNLKQLISPFSLTHSLSSHKVKRHAPPCNCDDSDEENNFGMAPDCAFVCNANSNSNSHKKSKKRGIKHAIAKTKRARSKH